MRSPQDRSEPTDRDRESPADPTWEELGASWRDSGESPDRGPSLPTLAELRERARRDTRRMLAVAAGEALVSIAALGAAAWFAFGGSVDRLLGWITAAGVATMVLVAGAHGIRNRRGLWRTADLDAAATARLLLERNRARHRGLVFGLWLVAAQFLAFALWIPYAATDGAAPSYTFLVAWCGGAVAVILLLLRRTRQERRLLDELVDGA